jgi:SET domain-containing protein
MDEQSVNKSTTQSVCKSTTTGCSVIIKDAGVRKGRGLFATQTIESGSIIENSPILLFQRDEWESHGKYTILQHYTFRWKNGCYAIALGIGSLFNHDRVPNVGWLRLYDENIIRFTALQKIEIGEELCISYGPSSLVSTWLHIDNDDESTSEEEEDNFLSHIAREE